MGEDRQALQQAVEGEVGIVRVSDTSFGKGYNEPQASDRFKTYLRIHLCEKAKGFETSMIYEHSSD